VEKLYDPETEHIQEPNYQIESITRELNPS